MNSLIVICCLLVLTGIVESRARPSDIEHHDIQMDQDMVAVQMREMLHEIVKRSTDILVEKKTVPIDWKSLMEIVSVVIQKVYELISAIANKLLSYALVKATPFLKENLLPLLIPGMLDHDVIGKPVASLTSVDWRSAANAIFNTLYKYQSLQSNQIV